MAFTLTTYQQLLTTLRDKGYVFQCFRDFLLHPAQKTVILRHDLDRLPLNALNIAKIENSLGVCSSFYFRITPEIFRPGIIEKIQEMGHEVGYHYEDLRLAGQEEAMSSELRVGCGRDEERE